MPVKSSSTSSQVKNQPSKNFQTNNLYEVIFRWLVLVISTLFGSYVFIQYLASMGMGAEGLAVVELIALILIPIYILTALIGLLTALFGKKELVPYRNKYPLVKYGVILVMLWAGWGLINFLQTYASFDRGVATGDMSACEKSYYPEKCQQDAAVRLNDVSKCPDLRSYEGGNCVAEISKNTRNMSLCAKIGDKVAQDYCYLGYAHEFGDRSACEPLTDNQYFYEQCLEKTEN